MLLIKLGGGGGGGLGSWTRSYSMPLLRRKEEKKKDGSVAALVVHSENIRDGGWSAGVVVLLSLTETAMT